MTDFTVTAHDFYSAMPLDVLMRIRSNHIKSLEIMNELIEEEVGVITETDDGFFLETDEGDSIFLGETVEEALDTISSL